MFSGRLAQEWARYKINANCIGPRLVVNRDLAKTPELVAALPMRRTAAPEA